MTTELSVLLPFRAKRERARARLICLPFAGGAAATYRGWGALLPDVDVCAVELPGRGTRLGEPTIDTLAQVAAVLIGIDRPDYVPDLCRVTCGKTAFTTPPRSIAFRINDSGPAFTDDTGQRPLTSLEEAMEFLESYLKAGPRAVSDVTRHAKLEGIAENTLRTAKRLMCDYCRKWNAGETQYVWSLKRRTEGEAEDTPTSPGRGIDEVLLMENAREMAFLTQLGDE